MNAAFWFSLANPLAMLGWIFLMASLAIGARTVWGTRLRFIAGRAIPLTFAAGYIASMWAAWGTAPGGGFSTLEQVMALFRSPGLVLAGWIHYLAFDLFVGRWILDNATKTSTKPWWIAPCLVLVFMFGPAGLLLYIVLRALIGKASSVNSLTGA